MESQYHNSPYYGPIISLKGINFNYGNLQVLRDIDLTVYPSECHAIVGEHGAGKSSLCMVISGALKPKSGTIIFKGKKCASLTIQHARNIGIEMVNQHNQLFDDFSVAHNLFVKSRFIKSLPLVTQRKLHKEAEAILSRYGFDIPPSTPLKDLTLSDRVLIDILKHIYSKPRLLILDEALEKLSSDTLEKVLTILKELQMTGMSIICISHRIDNIYHFADKVSIIKNGELLITDKINEIDKINLIKIAYTQITKNKSTEDVNKEFYNLLKYNEAILQNLPINLMVTDRHNMIKLINSHGRKHFKMDRKNLQNISLRDLFGEENEETLTLLENALVQRKDSIFFNTSLKVNGEATSNNIKVYPIFDGTFFIGNIIIIEDITAQEEMRAQLILSEKLASIGLLAAGVAHEINNPLEIIYNDIDYLKYQISDDSLHTIIENLDNEIHYIANIVSNLITFSDDKKINKEDVDLNEIIFNILSLIRYNAKHKNIKIFFDPADECVKVTANKNEIKQVILNLLKNSFEAMPSGGKIYIDTKKSRNENSDIVSVHFRDTGYGIKDNTPYNIFLPFYSTKTEKAENLGLGLTISYGIIKKYNGSIKVENCNNAGCRFTITFPQ
jgi:signal transduction histidine kinase/ABC-type branched-subunit amino acid transport system ATPase component